jgi:hypothetical protein
MHNLGFLVRTLGASQEAFQLVKNANHAITEDNNIIVFSETPNMPCIQPNFCNMQLAEAWGYKHPLIATRLVLAKKLLSFPGTQEYPSQIKNYNAFAGIYRNPKLKLIARSKSHKDIIEDCWNVLVTGIVEDYNINQFIEIINAERNRQGLLAA